MKYKNHTLTYDVMLLCQLASLAEEISLSTAHSEGEDNESLITKK
jgi:hypothetical protein